MQSVYLTQFWARTPVGRDLQSRKYLIWAPLALLLLLVGAQATLAQTSNGPFCQDYVIHNQTNTNFPNGYINGITVSGKTMYVPTGSGTERGALCISDNGAYSFTSKIVDINVPAFPKFPSPVKKVALRGNIIYVLANGELRVSTDGGNTFKMASSEHGNVKQENIEFAKDIVVDGNRVYVLSSWFWKLSYFVHEYRWIDYSEDGIHFRRMRASDVDAENHTIRPNYLAASANIICIGGYETSDLIVSSDGGNSFRSVPLTGRSGNETISSVYVDPGNRSIYVGTTSAFYISTDQGNSFTRYTGFTVGDHRVVRQTVKCLYAQGKTIYVGTRLGLSISTDGGATFRDIPRFTNCDITGITVEGGQLYVAYQGDAGGFGGIGFCANCPSAIQISVNPQNQGACTSRQNGLKYSVSASGTALSYDWEYNDGNGWASLSTYDSYYPGYNTATMTTNGFEQSGRQYRCRVYNDCGSVYSQPATFTLLTEGITITRQPLSQSYCTGTNNGLRYIIGASGKALRYDWEYNDGQGWNPLSTSASLYPGYNTDTLYTIGNEANGRQYRARVYNDCSSEYSQTATFTLQPEITFTQQPISQSACTASKNGLQYSVSASGSYLCYDWEFNDGGEWTSLSSYRSSYPGYNTATLTTNGDERNGRQYRARVYNVCGSEYSQSVTFTYLQPLAITQQPTSATSVLAGASVSASVSVSGTASAYQWYKDDRPLSGQTSSTLSLTNVQTADAGSYWLVIDSPCQSLTSTPFNLSVTPLVDLGALIYVLPSTVYGTSKIAVVVDVVEMGGMATSGSITLKLTRDAKLSLNVLPEITKIGAHEVQNSLWQLSLSDPNYYILTTTAPIPQGGKLTVGLTGVLDPQSTSGEMSIGGDLFYSSAEQNTANNFDGEKIVYFP